MALQNLVCSGERSVSSSTKFCKNATGLYFGFWVFRGFPHTVRSTFFNSVCARTYGVYCGDFGCGRQCKVRSGKTVMNTKWSLHFRPDQGGGQTPGIPQLLRTIYDYELLPGSSVIRTRHVHKKTIYFRINSCFTIKEHTWS